MRVYIGWDSRFPEPGHVLAHSLRKHSSIPLDIRFLDYRHLHDCYGFNRVFDPKATTEFTYSRFLVPYLCGYSGFAVFMDNDALCLGNIGELDREVLRDSFRSGKDKNLYVVKHEHQVTDGSIKMSGVIQTAYPRKAWSSVMAMWCEGLKCWTKEVVETASGARLHRFEDIPDDEIGSLDPKWNSLDTMDENTKLIHWTSGGPWNDLTKEWPHQDVWFAARKEWLIATGQDPNTPVKSQKT